MSNLLLRVVQRLGVSSGAESFVYVQYIVDVLMSLDRNLDRLPTTPP